MIIERLLTFIQDIFQYIFSLLPSVPQMPSSITTPLNTFIDLLFDNVGVLGVFVSLDLIKILVPLIIIVVNFEEVYKIVMWILKKIPMLNIE